MQIYNVCIISLTGIAIPITGPLECGGVLKNVRTLKMMIPSGHSQEMFDFTISLRFCILFYKFDVIYGNENIFSFLNKGLQSNQEMSTAHRLNASLLSNEYFVGIYGISP